MNFKKRIERRILITLARGKPVRRKHLLSLAHSAREIRAFDVVLNRLVKSCVVRRMRFGVYIDGGVPIPNNKAILPLNALPKGPKVDKIIQLLRQPKLPAELRKEVGISRQRVHQILGRFLAAGKIARHKIRGKKLYAYVRLNR